MVLENLVHVLLVSFPGQGHVNPLLRLGKRLAEKGLLVTFSTTIAFGLDIKKASGVTDETIPIGNGFLRFKFFDDGWAEVEPKRTDLPVYLPQLDSAGRKSLTKMINEFAEEKKPVACIINNPFIPWAVDLAVELGIPSAVLWVQSCAVFTAYYHYFHKLVTFPSETDPDVVVHLPTLPPLKNNEIPDFLNPRSLYPVLKMIILEQFKNLSDPFCILMDTFEDLELENIRYMSKLLPIKAVGPLFKSSKPQNKAIRGDQMKADDCIEWLHSQSKSSVVYISFGTVVYIPQEQVEEIAHALMNSNLSFLWVLKPPHKDFSFLKKHILPEGFSEKTAGRGKVVQFSPQEEVLAHPSLACFVTHCGWNSTVETLTSGVPVVTFPAWGDQVTNAKFLVDVYGVGIKLGHSEIEEKIMCREEVKKCLLEATVGTKAEQLREKALKWKVAAEGAVAEGGSSDCNLQCFVEYIKRKSTVALVNGVSNHVDQSA
uniref:Glycosyltransferase n=1 Tax=Polygala tenuifolia TaxID=355332 RepID=A0A3G3NBE0_9FABA|nr:UDP-glucosyltransferase UGT84A32 [Polygala tenuifolia]